MTVESFINFVSIQAKFCACASVDQRDMALRDLRRAVADKLADLLTTEDWDDAVAEAMSNMADDARAIARNP